MLDLTTQLSVVGSPFALGPEPLSSLSEPPSATAASFAAALSAFDASERAWSASIDALGGEMVRDLEGMPQRGVDADCDTAQQQAEGGAAAPALSPEAVAKGVERVRAMLASVSLPVEPTADGIAGVGGGVRVDDDTDDELTPEQMGQLAALLRQGRQMPPDTTPSDERDAKRRACAGSTE